MSAQVTASELFPFLSVTNHRQRQQHVDQSFGSTAASAASASASTPASFQEYPLKEVKFISTVTEGNEGEKVIYNQVCAQPQYEKLHPYQLRMQLEYPQLYERTKLQVQRLLEQKREAERTRERQYRQLLFGVSA